MPMLKPCIGRLEDGSLCGVLTDGRTSRCPTCAPAYEKRRDEAEPWRLFYDDPRWFSVKRKVRERDGQQCTYQVGTRKCISEGPLSVHHEEKLRHLWERCGNPRPRTEGWTRFVRMGLDMKKLRTLCESHHKLVDNTNPDEKWLGKPSEFATSQHRRYRRHAKRRTIRKKQIYEGREREDTGDDEE